MSIVVIFCSDFTTTSRGLTLMTSLKQGPEGPRGFPGTPGDPGLKGAKVLRLIEKLTRHKTPVRTSYLIWLI